MSWFTSGISISLNKKNEVYMKFCLTKEPEKKSKLHKQYKVYKYHIMNLSRKSRVTFLKIFLRKISKTHLKNGKE